MRSERPAAPDLREGHAALESTRNRLVAQLARRSRLRRVIPDERELLHRAEEVRVTLRGRPRARAVTLALISSGVLRTPALRVLAGAARHGRRRRGAAIRLGVEPSENIVLLVVRALQKALSVRVAATLVHVDQGGEKSGPFVG